MARAPRINHARYGDGTRVRRARVLKKWLAERGAALGRTVVETYKLVTKKNARAVGLQTTIEGVVRTLPVITGTKTSGQTLTVSPGVWSGVPAPTLTRAWMRDNVVIEGATGLTYVLVAGDVGKKMSVRETATNSAGAVSADSLQTTTVV